MPFTLILILLMIQCLSNSSKISTNSEIVMLSTCLQLTTFIRHKGDLILMRLLNVFHIDPPAKALYTQITRLGPFLSLTLRNFYEINRFSAKKEFWQYVWWLSLKGNQNHIWARRHLTNWSRQEAPTSALATLQLVFSESLQPKVFKNVFPKNLI